MNKNDLRHRAEAIIDSDPETVSKLKTEDIQKLVQELQIFETELEMQNEELLFSQQELAKARDEYLDLYDFAPVGYFTISSKGIIQKSNLSGARLFGENRSALINRPFSSVVADRDQDDYFKFIRHHKTLNDQSSVEICFKKSNGEIFWGKIDAAPVDANNNEQVNLCVTDINDRYNAELRARESNKKWKITFDSMADGVSILSKDQTILNVNDTLSNILGKNRDYLIGKKWYDVLHVDDKSIEDSRMAESLKSKSPSYFETYESGIDKYIGISISPIFDENGDLVHIVHTIVDITERKNAEKLLMASEEKYRGLVENSDRGIALISPDFKILSLNRQMKNWFPDINVDDNLTCYKAFNNPPREKPCSYCPVTKALKDGQRHESITETPTPDGIVNFKIVASPVLNGNGEITSVIESVEDCTETLRLQQLESRASRLEMAGTLAGQVAHDFNNLLGPIMAYPDIMREELPADHEIQKYITDIENAAKKIADINQDLLTMGRRGHYEQLVLKLNKIVRLAVLDLKPSFDKVVFDVDLCTDLMNIRGGSTQIHRALINLLYNACDSMGNVGRLTIKSENYYADDVSIAFGRVPKGEYVKLTISDTGCGIPYENLQKILEPFFTTKAADKKRGSGLGMSVVDAVIKDHQGYLDVSSKVGFGTSFYIYFPICRDREQKAEVTKSSNGNEKILIIDDDDMQRRVTSIILESGGYKVSSVDSGISAIEFIKDNPQDILVLDMVMPNSIDGAETYKRILENYPSQKAIIVSGYTETDRVLLAQSLGAGDFVKKPFTKKSILSAIRNVLDLNEVESSVSE